MGEAKRLRDRIKAEQERSEREDKFHKRAQRAEGDLMKAHAEIARLQVEVERLKRDSYSKEWAELRFAAARNDALEEASRELETMFFLLTMGTPEEGPFTQQDRTREEVIEQGTAAILALKRPVS